MHVQPGGYVREAEQPPQIPTSRRRSVLTGAERPRRTRHGPISIAQPMSTTLVYPVAMLSRKISWRSSATSRAHDDADGPERERDDPDVARRRRVQ